MTTETQAELVDEQAPQQEPQDETTETALPVPPDAQAALRLDALREEFGAALADIVVDAEFNDDVARLILEAEDAMRGCHAKTRFIIHREPSGELYLLRTVRPSEFQAVWLSLLSGQDEAAERYQDPFLRAVMLEPSFDQTAWDWEDDKKRAPGPFTKRALYMSYFERELPTGDDPTSVAFDRKGLDAAATVARRRKPSL